MSIFCRAEVNVNILSDGGGGGTTTGGGTRPAGVALVARWHSSRSERSKPRLQWTAVRGSGLRQSIKAAFIAHRPLGPNKSPRHRVRPFRFTTMTDKSSFDPIYVFRYVKF